MKFRYPLRLLFYLNVLVVALLLGYKAYLNFFLPDFEAEHTTQIERIQQRLDGRDRFSFAVVGNIDNSIGVFEHRMIPLLNASDVDFLVSAGNAVSAGGEDKYRALFGTLSHLRMPYLLTFGVHEHDAFGSYRFYEHFGPHFYSVRAANSRFVFLDSTGKTPWRWQILWLKDLLQRSDAAHLFLFLGSPLLKVGVPDADNADDDEYLQPDAFRNALLELIRQYPVDAVFSAELPLFAEQVRDGTRFVTTGGAGGLVRNDDASFYHFVKVSVNRDRVSLEVRRLKAGQSAFFKQLEGLWLFIYSLFYVGYLNFILLVSLLMIAAIRLYALVFTDRDFYPDFDLDITPWVDKPLRIAMFTNNYLPFLGGVPISIDRLRQGLESLGNQVLVVAPVYRGQPQDETDLLRVPTLLTMGAGGEYRLANLFLGRIRSAVRDFRPDLIHVHHPFWLGSLGLFIARRQRIPVVYTYHTRLELYAHFVPLPGTLFRNLISHALIRRFANRCDGVIVPTYSAEEYLRMIGVKTPLCVRPTGIAFESFQAVPAQELRRLRKSLGLGDERVLISVCRLSDEKNIDFMIDAVAKLAAECERPFRFLLIGDGHERGRLQRRIDALDLGHRVRLLGAVPPDRMPLYYRLGDLFLFASKSETQGMVILEAMAAGLPVVAVRSSGIDDLVRDGYNGFKTPENASVWCERVVRLLQDEGLRREFSGHALTLAQEHSIEGFAGEVKAFYARVLAASSDR